MTVRSHRPGSRVEAGQPIGWPGNTGMLGRPHAGPIRDHSAQCPCPPCVEARAVMDVTIDALIETLIEGLAETGHRSGLSRAAVVAVAATYSDNLSDWLVEHYQQQIDLGNMDEGEVG